MNPTVVDIFSDVFLLENDEIHSGIMRDDIDLWDSLNHLRLVTAIEQAFEIQLSMQEIESIDGIDRLSELVAERIQDK